MIEAGIESTLAPDNRLVAQHVHLAFAEAESARQAALFDPQTSGGLLFGIANDAVDSAIGFLGEAGFSESAVIGVVCPAQDQMPTLTIR